MITFVWGYNSYGQLGNDDTTNQFAVIQIGSSNTYKSYYNGQAFSAFLDTNDKLWLAGNNYHGQLGTNDIINYSSPVQEISNSQWTKISLAPVTLLGIKQDGTLWGWGNNPYGALGNDSTTPSSSPVQEISYSNNWIHVCAAEGSSFGIKNDNSLWAWGYNIIGELGLGYSGIDISSPVQVGTDNNWKFIDSFQSSLAIKTDNTLWAWGRNYAGQLGINNTDAQSSPVQVGADSNWSDVRIGGHSVAALKQDGSLWVWGQNAYGQCGLDNRISYSSPVQLTGSYSGIAASILNLYFLDSSSRLWGSGINTSGGLANSGPDCSSPVQIDGTTPIQWVSLGLPGKSASNFMGALGNFEPTPTPTSTPTPTPTGPTPTPTATPGATQAPALPSKLFGWGENIIGNLGINTTDNVSSPLQVGTDSDWVYINGAPNMECAGGIKSDGTLWLWGFNYASYLGNGSVNSSSPTQILGGGTNWYQFSIGGQGGVSQTGLGVKTDGSLWGWGENSSGTLGNNTTVSITSPENTNTGTDWNRAFVSRTACGIKVDDTLWVWGFNYFGTIGDNTIVPKSSPVQIAGYWLTASMGANHMGGIKKDGSLWMWGENGVGQLGENTSRNRSVPVQVGTGYDWKFLNCGETSTAAIKNDGSLWMWGNNPTGELADNTFINRSSPVQIYGGGSWLSVSGNQDGTAAIKSDGSVWCWGSNTGGVLGIDSGSYPSVSSPVQALLQGTWASLASSQSAFFALGAALPTPTPSPTPTESPTPTPSNSPSPTPTTSPSPTPISSPTPTPTVTTVPLPTSTPSATFNSYTANLTDPLGQTSDIAKGQYREGLQGNLDTSCINLHSRQRTAYITIVDKDGKTKVVQAYDGVQFSREPQPQLPSDIFKSS